MESSKIQHPARATMATEKQVAANRRNAQKSTGPATPEGRAAVRFNAVKHGLTASTLVLEGESEAEFEQLLDSFEAEHQPSTATEVALVREIAMAEWRRLRFHHMEARFFRFRNGQFEDADQNLDALTPEEQFASIAKSDACSTLTLHNLSRYKSRRDRSFYQALRELQRLRAERRAEMKNQTQNCPAPPVKKPAPRVVSPPAPAPTAPRTPP